MSTHHLAHAVRTATRPGLTRGLPHGPEDLQWVANAATLVYGARDAVLIDTYTSISDNADLVAWVRSFDRNLTHVVVTHGHGDHFFGIGQLLEAFPGARAVSSAGTAVRALTEGEPQWLEGFWERLFPGQIPDVAFPEALDTDDVELEGHRLEVIEAGFTDTPDSTAIWVPDLGLVVGGDVVYNDTHLYTAESTPDSREDWVAALGRLAALGPRTVVAAHQKHDATDDPRILEETAAYLRAFSAAVATCLDPTAAYERMLERFLRRANPGALWGGVQAAFADG